MSKVTLTRIVPIFGTWMTAAQQREHNTVPGSWPTSNVVVASTLTAFYNATNDSAH